MKLLIDTNVILDMVFKRGGCDIAMEMFRKVKEIGASAYITASSVTDIFYIIRKETHDTSQTYVIMENIFRLVAILSVTEKDIQDAFVEKWRDFEDCVQYMTGKNNGMDYIITANRKDYEDAMLPVMTPTAWIGTVGDMQKNK
ncbi:MAG: PIN domain-containing protein [Lachnospiraceae bacterium]|nr:PIN domain-containing protein [Lachnospiraceae bacterium]